MYLFCRFNNLKIIDLKKIVNFLLMANSKISKLLFFSVFNSSIFTCKATWPAGCSEKGLEPLNQVMTAAGLAPQVLHIKLKGVPSSTGRSAPITSVLYGRTKNG